MRLMIVVTTGLLGVAALAAAPVALPGLDFVPSAVAASRLGDLAGFRKIVVETQALVDKGDMPGAKARIKDLETAWDDAEPSLKPRAAADWHVVDKAIDRALAALRSNSPDAATSKAALADLLTKMDAA